MSGDHAPALPGIAPDLASYDHVLVFTSGGKDSTASLIVVIEAGADPARIELHHHEVDGRGPVFMDWPVTPSYCRALAAAFVLPILFSWREGGLLREMLRDGTPTAPVGFERPDGGTVTVGGKGPPGRRLRFPQVSADLSVRWCSAVAKVDVCRTLICNQPRFLGRRVLVVTGERAQESAVRARYACFEPHRTDTHGGARCPRHVDHWRPVHGWREQQVWDAMRRHGIVPHVAYQLGFGRLSCMSCIFMSCAQAASVRYMAPHLFRPLAVLEQRFGCTVKRGVSRWHDHGRIGMTPGDLAVNVVLIVRAIRSERGNRVTHLIQQGADLRAVVDVAGGQRRRNDPPGVGVHAEVQLAPIPTCPGAVLFHQPFARAAQLQAGAVHQQVYGSGAGLWPCHRQRLGPSAQRGVVRHGEIKAEQGDDGAD